MPGLAIVLVLSCLGLSACGSSRGEAPKLSTVPAAPKKLKTFVLDGADVAFPYPSNWEVKRRSTPGVATVSTGGASATVWAYRTQALVVLPVDQRDALARVLASLKRRDPGFQVEDATIETREGLPAIEILGETEINGHDVRIRSSHVWKGDGEYVIDQFADPIQYPKVDREVFTPMLDGLKVGGAPPAAAVPAPAPAG